MNHCLLNPTPNLPPWLLVHRPPLLLDRSCTPICSLACPCCSRNALCAHRSFFSKYIALFLYPAPKQSGMSEPPAPLWGGTTDHPAPFWSRVTDYKIRTGCGRDLSTSRGALGWCAGDKPIRWPDLLENILIFSVGYGSTPYIYIHTCQVIHQRTRCQEDVG